MCQMMRLFGSASRRLFAISTGRWLVASVVLFVVAAGATFAAAPQAPEQGTVWDGVFTAEQAERGRVAFAANGCTDCHGFAGAFDGRPDMFPPLAGDGFVRDMTARPVAYLHDYILANKPQGNPGTLTSAVALDLTAYILRENRFPAGAAELTAERAARAQIVPDGWDGKLPASTLVRVVGCLARGESGNWLVNRAVAPARLEGSDIDPAAATRPLGDHSFDLLFVLTPLDDRVGHRVWVRGVLVGDDGVDGITVSQVESLDEACQ